jgi:hypothetical protein
MARYKAKCWLGSASGYQELEVQSSTNYGAEQQFKRIYGAEQVINLRRVSNSNTSIPTPDISGYGAGIVALVLLWLIIEYWWIIVPIASLATLTYLYQRFKK